MAFFRVIAATFLGILATPALAASCFETHLSEAAYINSQRASIYRDKVGLAGGGPIEWMAAAAVSNQLIASERILQFTKARGFDVIGDRFQEKAGFHLTCDAFESMSKIGDMNFQIKPPKFAAVPRPVSQWVDDLRYALANNRDRLLLIKLESIIGEVESSPYDCMLRHVLQSVRRFAQLKMINLVAIKNEPELEKAINKLISIHLGGLWQAYMLDVEARSIHALGIPIVCNDVPDIPSLVF